MAETRAATSTAPHDQGHHIMSSTASSDCGGGFGSFKEIDAIKSDLEALRTAIEVVRAQYEERMAGIRQAHQSILAELGDDDQDQEEATELGDEVKLMEMKMTVLKAQADGLETALDRYMEVFMEEMEGSMKDSEHGGK